MGDFNKISESISSSGNECFFNKNAALETKDIVEYTKEYLKRHEINVKTKMFKNCEHRIPVEGSSLGLTFLKKNLL